MLSGAQRCSAVPRAGTGQRIQLPHPSNGEKSSPFGSCLHALALSSSLGLKARSGKWFVLFHNIIWILLCTNVEDFSLDEVASTSPGVFLIN